MKVGTILLYGGIVAGGTAAYFLLRNRNSQSVSSPYKGVKLSDYFSVTDKAGALANRAPSSKTLTALFANKKL